MSEQVSSLQELLATPVARDRTKTVTVAGLGTFRLRAFSLREFHEMQRAAREDDQFDEDRWEVLILQHGIAEPELTYDQAVQLTLRPAYMVQALVTEIGKLSGLDVSAMLTKDAIDRAEASFRQGSDQVPAVRPGRSEADDSEAASG